MKKKWMAMGLAAAMTVAGVAALAGCTPADDEITVGFIALHDDNSTYDKNFLDAIREACANKGIDDDHLIIYTNVPEENDCYDKAADLAGRCDVVFADSFGHEPFILAAAKEFPEVQFCHATGTMAHTEGVANHHNAFAHIYEGRYLAGVAAGMKLVEMHEAGKLEEANYDADGNIKIGYVGAYPYAEVVSGYTSFFLGAQSVVEEETDISVSMEVTYTSSWFDEAAERESANNLISRGAALISQHADSMGAPSACEVKGVPNVSYNGSTANACPNTYIISSRINWVPYFEYMIDCVMNGEEIAADWTGTLANGAVALTEVGAAAAEGTAEKIEEVKAQLMAGTLHVFDCSKFTVNGEHITEYMADVDTDEGYEKDTQVIENGVFMESKYRSAPYFDLRIDGITELNAD